MNRTGKHAPLGGRKPCQPAQGAGMSAGARSH